MRLNVGRLLLRQTAKVVVVPLTTAVCLHTRGSTEHRCPLPPLSILPGYDYVDICHRHTTYLQSLISQGGGGGSTTTGVLQPGFFAKDPADATPNPRVENEVFFFFNELFRN